MNPTPRLPLHSSHSMTLKPRFLGVDSLPRLRGYNSQVATQFTYAGERVKHCITELYSFQSNFYRLFIWYAVQHLNFYQIPSPQNNLVRPGAPLLLSNHSPIPGQIRCTNSDSWSKEALAVCNSQLLSGLDYMTFIMIQCLACSHYRKLWMIPHHSPFPIISLAPWVPRQ